MLVLSYGAFPVYADNDASLEVEKMIREDLHGNISRIREQAWNLTNDERKILLLKYIKSPVIPEILNIVLGFGLGSYTQGDKIGGLIGTLGGVAFFTSLTGSLVYLLSGVALPAASYGWFVAAGATGIFYATFEVLRPISFSRLYNEALIDALRAKEKVTFSLLPAIVPVSEGPAPNLNRTEVGALALIRYSF